VDSPPTGTVTFLFTDIEGSTKLWESGPEAMSEALLRHDKILRETIEIHEGHVFKTVGDAFCAAFSTAKDALEAALESQRSLVSSE
jgi:class 3 adenylate cyclase